MHAWRSGPDDERSWCESSDGWPGSGREACQWRGDARRPLPGADAGLFEVFIRRGLAS